MLVIVSDLYGRNIVKTAHGQHFHLVLHVYHMLFIQVVGMEQLVNRTVVNPTQRGIAGIALRFQHHVEHHERLLEIMNLVKGPFGRIHSGSQMWKPTGFIRPELYAVTTDEASPTIRPRAEEVHVKISHASGKTGSLTLHLNADPVIWATIDNVTSLSQPVRVIPTENMPARFVFKASAQTAMPVIVLTMYLDELGQARLPVRIGHDFSRFQGNQIFPLRRLDADVKTLALVSAHLPDL